MINAAAIEQIIALYAKHGWTLRRVLLSEALQKSLSTATSGLFGDAEPGKSELDAAWFSRSSRPDCTAWEIRHLSETPYALVEVIDDETSAKDTAEILKSIEAKMLEILSKRPRGN